jgi:hypothetical protein
LGPDDGPDPDHVSAPDLDGDERSREDVGVVLLEGGFCHLKTIEVGIEHSHFVVLVYFFLI